jgi:hypothetical protein
MIWVCVACLCSPYLLVLNAMVWLVFVVVGAWSHCGGQGEVFGHFTQRHHERILTFSQVK